MQRQKIAQLQEQVGVLSSDNEACKIKFEEEGMMYEKVSADGGATADHGGATTKAGSAR